MACIKGEDIDSYQKNNPRLLMLRIFRRFIMAILVKAVLLLAIKVRTTAILILASQLNKWFSNERFTENSSKYIGEQTGHSSFMCANSEGGAKAPC